MEMWVCNKTTPEYDYFDNQLNYTEDPPAPGESGTTNYETVVGDPCIRKRSCDTECGGFLPEFPHCISTQSWTTFVWVNNLLPLGTTCSG